MNREEQEYALRWNNHENNICLVLESMLKRGALVDVTLFCEGKSIQVHRAILSACSPYFEELFMEAVHPHPIVILKDVKIDEMQALIDYMYTGQVTVSQSKLPNFLKTAQSLKIRGLANAEQCQEDLILTTSENHIPLRKRRRNFSSNESSQSSVTINSKDPFCSSEGPTDLSLPKLEPDVSFHPIIQTVSYSAVDPTNANQSSKIYLKPKEALISPPSSDTSECSEKSIDQERFIDPGLISPHDQYGSNNHTFSESNHENSIIFNNQSDDEDGDQNLQESESSPMVRSGICTVCGCFRSDLRQHMESHSGQSFQCHLCGRAYPRRKTLNQHIKRSHQVYTQSAQSNETGSSQSATQHKQHV